MASVARCPLAAGCSYAFPNVVLPFIGGFLVDRIGVRKAYVFLSALLTTAQYPLPHTASDVPRSRNRTRGIRPAWSAPPCHLTATAPRLPRRHVAHVARHVAPAAPVRAVFRCCASGAFVLGPHDPRLGTTSTHGVL